MLLHISHRDEWAQALEAGRYEAASLTSDGFIHCSTPAQLLIPANAIYRGQRDLVLLCMDPALISAPIVYEDCYESGHEFPHVYGPINLEAVIQVVEFPPNADGSFSLPAGIAADEGVSSRAD
jgi:uncharacterized protein (DUF952 family)